MSWQRTVSPFNARLAWRLALSLGAVGLLGCGAGAKGDCPALDSCGGTAMATGNWKVVNPLADVCQVPVVRPTQPSSDVSDFANHTTLLPPTLAPPQPNPVLLQQTTSGDWCSSLVLTPSDSVENANLWHDAPELDTGTLNLASDHSYLTSMTFSTKNLPRDRNTTHFAPRCLLANGGGHPDPTTGLPKAGICDVLAVGLNKYYSDGRITPTVPANFANIACTNATDGGCDCTYVYTVQIDDLGGWTVPVGDPSTLVQDSLSLSFNGVTLNSQEPSASMKSTFCASPTRLQLSGWNGGSLFTLQGLRTLVLSAM
jgi:hypothetical protein